MGLTGINANHLRALFKRCIWNKNTKTHWPSPVPLPGSEEKGTCVVAGRRRWNTNK